MAAVIDSFTDYSLKAGYGQLVVMGQLVSGILLLNCALPASDLTNFHIQDLMIYFPA